MWSWRLLCVLLDASVASPLVCCLCCVTDRARRYTLDMVRSLPGDAGRPRRCAPAVGSAAALDGLAATALRARGRLGLVLIGTLGTFLAIALEVRASRSRLV